MSFRALQPICVALVICATLLPRLLMLGAPPATDEGIYAFNALMIFLNPAPGHLLPDLGTLSLYQALSSWIFLFDINHLIALRGLDALVATLAGWMLYQVTRYESKSMIAGAVISIFFLVTLNDPVFIQYGYKNSIAAASLPLLGAIAAGQRIAPNDSLGWFSVGALTSVVVLLREPFAILAMAGILVVYMRGGWGAARAYVLGGILIGGAVLVAMVIMRGGYQNLLRTYMELTLMYDDIAYQRLALLKSSTIAFVKNSISVLLLTAASLYWIMLAGTIKPEFFFRLGFWLLLATVPLLEPLLKNGYPYHYANTLFGLAGIVALGWRAYLLMRNEYLRPAFFIFLIASIFLIPKLSKFNDTYNKYTSQLGTSKSAIDWPLSIVEQSNYLLIAAHINKNSQSQGNTTVAINGSMLGVIPLAKARPSSPELAHLSYRYIYTNKDKKRLKAEIEGCPPEFIMLTNSSPFHDTQTLNAIVKSIPDYQLSTYIPQDDARHYGSFDGAIYKWTGKPIGCHRNHQERQKK